MNHDPEVLRSLATRCEAGESGPNFDCVIAEALGLGRCRSVIYTGRPLMTQSGPTPEIMYTPEWPPLTTSIDAQSILGVDITWIIQARKINGDLDFWHAESLVKGVSGSSSRARAPTETLARLATSFRSLALAGTGR